MKARALLASAFGALLLAAGCGGGNWLEGTIDPRVVGTWTRTAMAIGDQSVGCPGIIAHDGFETSCAEDEYVFRSDGTCSHGDGAYQWRLWDNTLRLTLAGPGELRLEAGVAFANNDGTMVLTWKQRNYLHPDVLYTQTDTYTRAGG
jgi:hypothetical protein